MESEPAARGTSVTLSCGTQLPADRSETQLRYSFYRGGYTLRSDWDSPEFWISEIWKEDSGYYWCEARTVSHSVSKQSQQSYIQVQSEHWYWAARLGGQRRNVVPIQTCVLHFNCAASMPVVGGLQ